MDLFKAIFSSSDNSSGSSSEDEDSDIETSTLQTAAENDDGKKVSTVLDDNEVTEPVLSHGDDIITNTLPDLTQKDPVIEGTDIGNIYI